MRDMIFALIFGVLLGGMAVFFYMSSQSERTVNNFAGAQSAGATSRAMQAYQHEDPAIAIWELRHLADREAEQLRRERVYTNAATAALLMTRARLARLYHEQGKDPEAQTNAQLAISLLRGFPGNNTTATNLESLLEFLRATDAKARKEPKYE
jgi:hypothetical protein